MSTKSDDRSPETPRPRLDGDDRAFVRFDPETGEILSHGHQRIDHIAAEAAAGIAILELEIGHEPVSTRAHRVNPATKKIETTDRSAPGLLPSALSFLHTEIESELRDSDHYFLLDRDTVTESERGAWAEYRRALRDAQKETTLAAALAKIPSHDPAGSDPFANFRGRQDGGLSGAA